MLRKNRIRIAIGAAVIGLWVAAVVALNGSSGLESSAGIFLLVCGLVAIFLAAAAACLLGLVVVLLFVGNLVFGGETRRFRRRMREAGRFLEWKHVAHKLAGGEGTLILEGEFQQFFVGGGWRIWWTPDDLLGAAPVELPSFVGHSPPPAATDDDRVAEYARWCRAKYIDEGSGTASLTLIMEPLTPGRFPRGADRPTREFPRAKVVTLFKFGSQAPIIGCGDDLDAMYSYIADRRPSATLCRQCGYDLRASPERCPECGTPVPPLRGGVAP